MPAQLLMTADQIKASPETWHQTRAHTIGGSEIAVVLGLAPQSHGTPFSLWAEKKLGQRADNEDVQDERARGLALEPYVASQLAAMRPDLEIIPGGMYRDSTLPWMTASLDRLAAPKEALGDRLPMVHTDQVHSAAIASLLVPVELKTALAKNWADHPYQWGEAYTDQVPVHLRAQAYWQMAVYGSDRVLMPCQFMGNWQTVLYVIHRTEDVQADIEFMIKAGAEFMDRLATNTPPPVDSAPATARALRTLHPMRDGDTYQCTPSEARLLARAYLRKKAAEETYALRVNRLIAKAGGAKKVVAANPEHPDKEVNVLNRSAYPMTIIQDGKLREQQPDIAAAYSKTVDVDKHVIGQALVNVQRRADASKASGAPASAS